MIAEHWQGSPTWICGRTSSPLSQAFEGFPGAAAFVFNLVFCATTATIVSGAMAERIRFSAYCIFSAVISLFIYPIEAHWFWGGGWLSQLGFRDNAGFCAIHERISKLNRKRRLNQEK